MDFYLLFFVDISRQSFINSHRLQPLPHFSTPFSNQHHKFKMPFLSLRYSHNMSPRVGWLLQKALVYFDVIPRARLPTSNWSLGVDSVLTFLWLRVAYHHISSYPFANSVRGSCPTWSGSTSVSVSVLILWLNLNIVDQAWKEGRSDRGIHHWSSTIGGRSTFLYIMLRK